MKRFLHHQKIFRAEDLPYRTQLVPLAAILVELGAKAEAEGARFKIAQWYWCGVLGELYGGAIETRFARDLPEVSDYVLGNNIEPITIINSNFTANRLLTLRTRNSAAYKGIYALLMRDGCLDFRTGEPIESQTFFEDNIDIHHIFPQSWCQKAGIQRSFFHSIINKTAISARTNRKIGGRAPSTYLTTLEKDAGIQVERMDKILYSHRIDPERLRKNDFWRFFMTRAEELLKIIEGATGKSITRTPEVFSSETEIEDYEEKIEEWEGEKDLVEIVS